jgi:hypothetical protein
MPPRKRRARRATGAVVCLSPRLTRPTYEVGETGYVFARRPGDDWRDRLQCVWRPAGTCPACARARFLLVSLAGEAAVCDLLSAVAYLARRGVCTCVYAPLEG